MERTPTTESDDNTTVNQGYTDDVEDFLSEWSNNCLAWKKAYTKEAVYNNKVNTVFSVVLVGVSAFVGSGTVYNLITVAKNMDALMFVLSITSLVLSIISPIMMILKIQDKAVKAFQASIMFGEIHNDILMNMSLSRGRRMFAISFLQNIVKRTEAIFLFAYTISDPKIKGISEKVLQKRTDTGLFVDTTTSPKLTSGAGSPMGLSKQEYKRVIEFFKQEHNRSPKSPHKSSLSCLEIKPDYDKKCTTL